MAFPQLLFLLGGSTVICFSMASNSLDRGVGSKTPNSAQALVHISYGWISDQSQRGEERDMPPAWSYSLSSDHKLPFPRNVRCPLGSTSAFTSGIALGLGYKNGEQEKLGTGGLLALSGE